MASLMLVNPRKRRKTRSAAQKRATRQLVARNKKRRSPTRSRAVTTKRRVIRRRRNPIAMRGIQGRIINAGKGGAIGAAGAIAGSIAGGYLPIPDNLKEGNAGIAVRALLGIATGFAAGKVVGKKNGELMAQGAVTVALHGAMKSAIQNAAPSINMGGMDYDDGLLGYGDEGLLGTDFDDLSAYDDYADDLGYAGAGHVDQSEFFE